eukprot:3816-Chlamydomonas_euryale.AAC.2
MPSSTRSQLPHLTASESPPQAFAPQHISNSRLAPCTGLYPNTPCTGLYPNTPLKSCTHMPSKDRTSWRVLTLSCVTRASAISARHWFHAAPSAAFIK